MCILVLTKVMNDVSRSIYHICLGAKHYRLSGVAFLFAFGTLLTYAAVYIPQSFCIFV